VVSDKPGHKADVRKGGGPHAWTREAIQLNCEIKMVGKKQRVLCTCTRSEGLKVLMEYDFYVVSFTYFRRVFFFYNEFNTSFY
jgi:hypothetical protein